VFHEETGKTSTYVIAPRDCGITTADDEQHLQCVTAMAVNPRDANQLLIAYEVSPTIFQWDVAKHKMIKEFTLLSKSKTTSSPRPNDPNSVMCLSWHASGKRFVAGYKHGGFGVFRYDKPHGLYHTLIPVPTGEPLAPVSRIHWICAPPTSRHSHLPGAVILAGGRASEDTNTLTIVFPPREMVDDEAITAFVKSEQLAWHSTLIQPKNLSEIAAFAIAADQVDYSSRLAPFSAIMLSGNPLDGQQPGVSVQCLPCFVRLREGDKEDWEWIPERMPKPVFLPPLLLQQSALTTCEVVSLAGCDGSLQADLLAAVDEAAIDPVHHIRMEQDFDWPINGGSVLEPLLKGFIPPTADSSGSHAFQSATLLLTGHTNGFVTFWEIYASSERTSRGTLKLLHVVDVAGQMNPLPTNAKISSIAFCAASRSLVVGFAAGEIAVLEFGKRSDIVKNVQAVQSPREVEKVGQTDASNITNELEADQIARTEAVIEDEFEDTVGFHVAFSLHIHSSSITKICFSSAYQYAAVADEAGVVSLIELTTHDYELLIFDVSSDEPVSVESLLLSELVQVTEIPVPALFSSTSTSPNSGNKSGSKSPPARASFTHRSASSPTRNQSPVIHHRDVTPILFVGRGNGKLEMFHVQTAKKIGESLLDPHKLSPLSSIIMLDGAGRRVDINGRPWARLDLGDDETADKDISAGVSKLSVSAELEQLTEQALAEAIASTADSEISTIQSGTEHSGKSGVGESSHQWPQTHVVETKTPAGSLGLHLFTEVQQHAVVKGFVLDNEKALALAAQGVGPGHTIVSINGVDLLPYSRVVVCSVLEKLRDLEKVMVFAKGFGPLPDTSGDSEVGSLQDALAEKPRLLLCTCGKSLHLLQAVLPRASEMAAASKEDHLAQPLASIDVSSQIVVTAIIRVPVQDRVESCVIVIDQSNRLYVISLMTLTMVWSVDCPALGSGTLDGLHCSVSASGEVIVASALGEVERISLLSDAVHKENAMLERMAVKTRLYLDERIYPFDKDLHASPKKKGGIAALKKLVSGTKDAACDLHKVFQFSAEDADRRRLMGDRTSATSPKMESDEKAAVKKTEQGLGATKDALNQAAQVRIVYSS
jgi:WD40 repeat protein